MEITNPASHNSDGLPLDFHIISSTNMADPLNNQADADTHFHAWQITTPVSPDIVADPADIAFDVTATTWADNVISFPALGNSATANSYIYIEMSPVDWEIQNYTTRACTAAGAGSCVDFHEFNSVVYKLVDANATGNSVKIHQEVTWHNPQNPMIRYHLWEPDANATNLRRNKGSHDDQPAILDAGWNRLPTTPYLIANLNDETNLAPNFPNDQEWLLIQMENTIELKKEGCIVINHTTADDTPIPGTCHLTESS